MAAVSPVQIDKAGTTAYFNAIATTGPADQATANLVSTLRSSAIPAAEKGTNMTAYVGGTTASNVDLAAEISSKLVLQILVVIALSFLLLLLAFRTVVIPVQAAVMNLLSIGAAYGVLTAIFQWGWLHSLIGLDGAVPIVSYVPLFMFAVLFGLSMDYEVFLVSQIKEHVDEGQDYTRSVISGLVTSAVVITAAASIMVFVFGSFVLNGDPTVKQFGIGLAVAVILDATVVRCLLVPARMIMMGKHAWYLPRWLGRTLPRISIEGAEYFQARDQALATSQAQHPAPNPPPSSTPKTTNIRGLAITAPPRRWYRPSNGRKRPRLPSPLSITRDENHGTSYHRPRGRRPRRPARAHLAGGTAHPARIRRCWPTFTPTTSTGIRSPGWHSAAAPAACLSHRQPMILRRMRVMLECC